MKERDLNGLLNSLKKEEESLNDFIRNLKETKKEIEEMKNSTKIDEEMEKNFSYWRKNTMKKI